MDTPHNQPARHGAATFGAVALTGMLLWADWPAARAMTSRWLDDPRYSHGVLVPLFAGYLFWRRRPAAGDPRVGSSPIGLLLIVAAAGMQLAGARLFFGWLQVAGLIAGLAGVATLWGGTATLRRALPALGFLIFMIPLPFRLEVALGEPLQRVGTLASTYALQTAGLPALAEGNIIRLGDRASIAVVEACNGLGMIAAFACYSTAAALLMTQRDPITRLLILVSSVPLALIANITRISATGIVHATLGGGAADLVFHDLAGWLMMPLALGLLWLELAVIGRILVVDESAASAPSLARLALSTPGPSRPIGR